MPFKEGGNGVNNCIIKAETTCDIIKIPINNLFQVLPQVSKERAELFNDKMLEKLVSSHLRRKNEEDTFVVNMKGHKDQAQNASALSADGQRQYDLMNLEVFIMMILSYYYDNNFNDDDGDLYWYTIL